MGLYSFEIPGNSDDYLDLPYSLIYVKTTIKRRDNTDDDTERVAAFNAQVGPVNNCLHPLFDQVTVSLNRQPASPPNNCYAYQTFI